MGGRALVEGIGELVTPLEYVARDVTLVLPGFTLDTASCYRAFDQLVGEGRRATGRNHLEEAAGLVEPRLARTLSWLRAEYGGGELCGSGSTMFIEGHVGPGTGRRDVQGPEGTVRFCQTTTTPA